MSSLLNKMERNPNDFVFVVMCHIVYFVFVLFLYCWCYHDQIFVCFYCLFFEGDNIFLFFGPHPFVFPSVVTILEFQIISTEA